MHEEREILHRITNIERLLELIMASQNEINALAAQINTAVTTLQSEAGDITSLDLTEITASVGALSDAVAALVATPDPTPVPDPTPDPTPSSSSSSSSSSPPKSSK
jgi:hypothetical protein